METEVCVWLSDEELEDIFSNEYWIMRRKKEWYILDGNSDKLFDYLKRRTTYYREF